MRQTSMIPFTILAALGLAVGCVTPTPPTPPADATTPSADATTPSTDVTSSSTDATPIAGQVIVDAADRSDADRTLDAGRHPAALLDFVAIAPGMVVADLGAGGGYTTELLARAVGDTGTVYGQNSTFLLERFAAKPWAERLKKPINARVVRADRDFDDPIPPEAAGTLDAVVDVLFYHDTVWLETDRTAMNAAIFRALKPGGRYIIVDHSAKAGDGLTVTKTLHRIEEQLVRDEIMAAGFVVDAEADFLRNPADTRDWNANPGGSGDKRGTSDRFVIAFKKPR